MAVCVHAHCYQPPRENPETGEVPLETSAAPQHDWNERITMQCYRPLAGARILRADGSVDRSVNLYAHVNFNVGPTLAVWLDRYAPDVMAAMVDGDRRSCARFDGHGNAVAQPWVHAILPLASPRDRATMIRWGIVDFEARFGRRPEGMWMPETAVDAATLDAMAEQGIIYTIVAPHQVAPPSGFPPVDTTEPSTVMLPSGRSIVAFAYDGALSHGIAFGELLRDGSLLARTLAEPVRDADGFEGLRSVATDAETFGHHHNFAEMALAFALNDLDANGHEVVSYAAWLDRHVAPQRAAIVDGTSWSCAHGIERWRSNCGCRIGSEPDSGQAWRTPLRESMDWLIERARVLTDERATEVFLDPWAARDDYVDVLIGRCTADEFALTHARPEALAADAIAWMEAHRHLLVAQSSCAWFFDDADGHETTLGIAQAEAALRRFEAVGGVELRAEWHERIAAMITPAEPSGSV
jgi:alpha-amylase/alpha-mannosidase (GH57 family)